MLRVTRGSSRVSTVTRGKGDAGCQGGLPGNRDSSIQTKKGARGATRFRPTMMAATRAGMWKRAVGIGSDGWELQERFDGLFVMMESPADLVKPRPKRLNRPALSYWLRLHAGGLRMDIKHGREGRTDNPATVLRLPRGVKMENHKKRNM